MREFSAGVFEEEFAVQSEGKCEDIDKENRTVDQDWRAIEPEQDALIGNEVGQRLHTPESKSQDDGDGQAIAIVVIAFGFIATAVCVLVGPIFIPFFIVPKLEWLFWGWFKCFIQYAFYQVIAAAVVYVIANLILGIFDLQPTGTISTAQLIEAFPVLFITFLASIYALLKIPALTNHIFSGTSGGSSAGILERVFG